MRWFSKCAVLAVSALVLTSLHSIAVPAASELSAEDFAVRAEKLLDQYEGDESVLSQAEQAIAASLEKQPWYPHALVEKARLTLIRGKESPESLQAAELLLQSARNHDFNYGRAYVLQGHVYTKLGNGAAAHQAFFTAQRLAANDPWFKFYYADFLDTSGESDKARQLREEFVASGASNREALRSAYLALLKTYFSARNRSKADAAYAELARLSPGDAWVRGDYAIQVIEWFLDFDAGQRYAREALSIMDYPHARGTLSLALYGKWAAAKRDGKDPKVVLALLKEAQAFDPKAQLVLPCALRWPSLEFLRQSLEALGAPRDPSLVSC